jgi:UDP-N-acetyl-D-glucosamine dehydrogenase
MPSYVVGRIGEALNSKSRAVRGAKILLYGIAYKKDVSDVRESPALTILKELEERGARVDYMDPHVAKLNEEGFVLESVDPDASFADYDLVVVITDHTALDKQRLMRQSPLIVDTRDALRGVSGDRTKVFGL